MKKLVLLLFAVVAVLVGAGLWMIVSPGHGAAPNLASGYAGLIAPEKLLRVPVTGIYPGGSAKGLNPDMQNPLANDPDAAARGAKDFDDFNCSGCHMARGGGGMGPALSNSIWIYRSSPANIYLSIAQGRAAGMPAFGAMLPDRTIWELVAYIQNISEKPGANFGSTTALTPPSPATEQVPAARADTIRPWDRLEPIPPGGRESGTSPEDYRPAAPLNGQDINKP
jgi:cytochrome c oxidase cbb3-type subunit 3